MRTNVRGVWVFLLALMAGNAAAAGHLVVENGWIRTAPPGSAMLAGYATLHNIGDAPVTVTGADSADFGSVSLHKSSNTNGMEHMQALGDITIGAGQRVTFAPGGSHFMLMQPKKDLRADESVPIHIVTKDADSTIGIFVVRDNAS
jgi:copper(I)-binding protein